MGNVDRLFISSLMALVVVFLLLAVSPVNARAETARWMKTYNGAAIGSDDCGYGVAVAKDGNVYVAGYTEASWQPNRLILRKYSSTGALRWAKTYKGTAQYGALGYGVAAAVDGGVYVSGTTVDGGVQGENILLQKYTATGVRSWTKSYNGSSNGNQRGKGVAVAADGSVYVSGTTSVGGQAGDLLLLKYK